jgi:hypothetical protein
MVFFGCFLGFYFQQSHYDLDVDEGGGYFVTPYDLLNSKYFDKVSFTP